MKGVLFYLRFGTTECYLWGANVQGLSSYGDHHAEQERKSARAQERKSARAQERKSARAQERKSARAHKGDEELSSVQPDRVPLGS